MIKLKIRSFRISIANPAFLALIALLSFHSTAKAQTSSTVLETNSDPAENIVVKEDKSTALLRGELRGLDLAIYRLLNSLIDDEYYNINCNFPIHTQTYTRKRLCDTGYGELASQYASKEATVMEAFDHLAAELLQESGLMMTELEQEDMRYREIVFEVAKENPNLAEKLLRRHYLQLVLNHRRENWWKSAFGMEVQPLTITASEIQFPSK